MAKTALPPKEALYPTPVVLVSSHDPATGRMNIITIAWCGVVCSEPPQIGVSIRPHRHSHAIIASSKEFVVNIPTTRILRETDICGIRSGKDTDKFAACALTAEKALHVQAPLIKECPVNIECRVTSMHHLGVHDLFIGTVLAVHVDGSIRDAGGNIDFAKAHPFVFNQGEYWSLGEKIGSYGYSAKK